MSGVHARFDGFGVDDAGIGGVVNLVILQADALAGAVDRGGDRLIDETHRDRDHAHSAAGVVARSARGISHVREAVLEQHEHVRAVIGAQAITRTEILADPDAHSATPSKP